MLIYCVDSGCELCQSFVVTNKVERNNAEKSADDLHLKKFQLQVPLLKLSAPWCVQANLVKEVEDNFLLLSYFGDSRALVYSELDSKGRSE